MIVEQVEKEDCSIVKSNGHNVHYWTLLHTCYISNHCILEAKQLLFGHYVPKLQFTIGSKEEFIEVGCGVDESVELVFKFYLFYYCALQSVKDYEFSFFRKRKYKVTKHIKLYYILSVSLQFQHFVHFLPTSNYRRFLFRLKCSVNKPVSSRLNPCNSLSYIFRHVGQIQMFGVVHVEGVVANTGCN